jgi:hypothetical protein
MASNMVSFKLPFLMPFCAGRQQQSGQQKQVKTAATRRQQQQGQRVRPVHCQPALVVLLKPYPSLLAAAAAVTVLVFGPACSLLLLTVVFTAQQGSRCCRRHPLVLLLLLLLLQPVPLSQHQMLPDVGCCHHDHQLLTVYIGKWLLLQPIHLKSQLPDIISQLSQGLCTEFGLCCQSVLTGAKPQAKGGWVVIQSTPCTSGKNAAWPCLSSCSAQ